MLNSGKGPRAVPSLPPRSQRSAGLNKASDGGMEGGAGRRPRRRHPGGQARPAEPRGGWRAGPGSGGHRAMGAVPGGTARHGRRGPGHGVGGDVRGRCPGALPGLLPRSPCRSASPHAPSDRKRVNRLLLRPATDPRTDRRIRQGGSPNAAANADTKAAGAARSANRPGRTGETAPWRRGSRGGDAGPGGGIPVSGGNILTPVFRDTFNFEGWQGRAGSA